MRAFSCLIIAKSFSHSHFDMPFKAYKQRSFQVYLMLDALKALEALEGLQRQSSADRVLEGLEALQGVKGFLGF